MKLSLFAWNARVSFPALRARVAGGNCYELTEAVAETLSALLAEGLVGVEADRVFLIP